MAVELLSCLSCSGKGSYFYICESRNVDCSPCNGTGKVLRDEAWIFKGEMVRRYRYAKELTMRELGRATGFRGSEVSDMETGRADPSPLLEALGL